MNARPSELLTAHGVLKLPVFLPDATRGVVRSVSSADLESVGLSAVVVNPLHLANHPGISAIASIGGIHRFMGSTGPVLSDSGGFQVYSLLATGKANATVTKKGFHYRLKQGQKKRQLTPEKSVQLQWKLQSDIVVALDHFAPPDGGPEAQRTSIENTVAWGRASRKEFSRLADQTGRRPLLFAVVQGGEDLSLRRECAVRLAELGFDGYGFGGRPVDDQNRLSEAVAAVAEALPADKPLWGLGIGKPEHIAAARRLGYGLFDCVLPTRDARHRRLYVRVPGGGTSAAYEYLYLQDDKHRSDKNPIDPGCHGECCQRYSRGYLQHLFRVKDALAPRLASLHNLLFYSEFVKSCAP